METICRVSGRCRVRGQVGKRVVALGVPRLRTSLHAPAGPNPEAVRESPYESAVQSWNAVAVRNYL